MLTNQIAQLEVGSSINTSPELGVALGHAHSCSILFGPWYKSVTLLCVGFYAIDTTSGLPSVVQIA